MKFFEKSITKSLHGNFIYKNNSLINGRVYNLFIRIQKKKIKTCFDTKQKFKLQVNQKK